MAGTREGGLKASKTVKKRYGEDWYRGIGAAGGEKSRGGGFAWANEEYTPEDPRHPRHAGSKGGRNSKRGEAKE